MYSSGRATAF